MNNRRCQLEILSNQPLNRRLVYLYSAHYLLSNYYVLGYIIGGRNTAVIRTNTILYVMEITVTYQGTLNI